MFEIPFCPSPVTNLVKCWKSLPVPCLQQNPIKLLNQVVILNLPPAAFPGWSCCQQQPGLHDRAQRSDCRKSSCQHIYYAKHSRILKITRIKFVIQSLYSIPIAPVCVNPSMWGSSLILQLSTPKRAFLIFVIS